MNLKVIAFSAATFAMLIGCAVFARQQDVTFERLQEARIRLADLGFHCSSDAANGHTGCGFLISRTALSWSEVGMLRKTGPMGPEWQGKVWVTLNPQHWRLESLPEHAGVRIWGSVIAFGDCDFLKEIDDAL